MNPITSIAALLLRPFVWLETLLTRDMKLQYRGGRIRLVDKEPVHSTRPPPTASAPRPDPSDDIELTMRTDLHQVITQHAQFPGSPNMIFTYILGRASAHATVS